ncbi:hypothetical protein AAG612_11130 [Citromicrobium bathyomarinum]|uniref:hypothetical protein n=1 Tax=Citromicrobium bathyomarinum TaxID=72174 RepID=UPI00315A1B26
MDPALLQLIGSLAAILVLAGIAWALKLGTGPHLADGEDAMGRAYEADTGFDPVEAVCSRDGKGAILTDARGRIMVLRRHGSHFAGRVLEPGAQALLDGAILTVVTTDRRYGRVTLDLGDDARAWASRIDALD